MTLPQPKSKSQILGSMLNSFLSRLGLPSIKKGDPSLSILEAAAQSDFRTSQDLLRALSLRNLDNVSGVDLDTVGRDERVYRVAQSPSSGEITVTDTSITKISSALYARVTAGSSVITVNDASAFPASGSLYLGRSTSASEGPLSYTSVVDNGTYWTITLSTPPANYHSAGHEVVVAQAGDRPIPAGSIVRTSVGSAGGQNQFRVLFDSTLPSGEVSVSGIPVQCLSPGVQGNVSAGAITGFVTPPFTGATATNPLPFANATATETDDQYRESIRLARKSRAKATSSAIVSALRGARASDEAGQILTATTSFRTGEPKTITIDDGTGYEPKSQGIVEEVLAASAAGGEQFFALQNRPIAKASVQSQNGPFVAVAGSTLTVLVDGVAHAHTFAASDFYDHSAASAYEVVASINGNTSLAFGARTVNSGLAVSLFARSELGENIQVQDTDANQWLRFGGGRKFSLNLFLNDRLLAEDGHTPAVTTLPHGSWGNITQGDDLAIQVDGIDWVVSVSDADFSARTSYTSVSRTNSVESWATVLTALLAGVTVTAANGRLRFESNKGRNDAASIAVKNSAIGRAMFASVPVSDAGVTSDYSLDRYSGHLALSAPLAVGDRLTAGSTSTRAFLETTTLTVPSTVDAWFCIDGGATFPETGFGVGTAVTIATVASPAWGKRLSLTSAVKFRYTQAGDFVVISDSALPGHVGAFRVAERIDSNTVHIEVNAATAGAASVSLTEGGIVVVRSATPPQKVTVASGTYSPTALAAAIVLTGATATATASAVRIQTNSADGELATVWSKSSLFGPTKTVYTSEVSHVAALATSKTQTGTPAFTENAIAAVGSTTSFTAGGSADAFVLAELLRPDSDAGPTYYDRYSNLGRVVSIENGTSTLTVRPAASVSWLVGDRLAYSRGYDLTGRDTLSVLVDSDSVGGSFSLPMYRQTTVASWGGTLELEETSGDSLAKQFGTDYDWRDFAVMFKSRVKSHLSPGDTNKTILWRWWRHGPEGDDARLQYRYPFASNSALAVETNNVTDVVVRLQSGAARAVPTLRSTSKLGVAVTATGGGLYTLRFVASFVTSLSRVVRVAFTGMSGGSFAAGAITIGAATATVVSNNGGTLTLTGIVGSITAGAAMTQGAVTATTTSAPYGWTTATLTLPGGVTDHGLVAGSSVVYIAPVGSFTGGARQIEEVVGAAVSFYDDVAAAAGPSASSLSFDPSGEVTLNTTAVVTGDIYSTYNATGVAESLRNSYKITVDAGGRSWSAQSPESPSGAGTGVVLWSASPGMEFYPLVSTTAAQVATAVSALSGTPVSATAVGTGGSGTATGVISNATYETAELGGTDPWYYLGDGYNWVRSHTTPATTADNFILTLRNALVGTALTSNADLANEDVRLVPVTAGSVARWLNSTAAGIGGRGKARTTADGSIAIESDSAGSASSVLVRGGTANVASVAVLGSAEGLYAQYATTDSSDGLGGLQYVWAVNATPHRKAVIDAATTLNTIGTDGVVTLDSGGTKAWTRIGSLVDNNVTYIERQGDFVAIHPLVTASVKVGDSLRIQAPSAPPAHAAAVSSQNTGLFTVARISGSTVWIENSLAVPEQCALKYDFIAAASVLPGDSVSFGSTFWGDNVGTRTVTALGATEWTFTLDPSAFALQAVTTSPGPLAGEASRFGVVSGTPARMLRRVVAIAPEGTGFRVKLDEVSAEYGALVSEAYGTSLVVANKLGFAGTAAVGSDAYRYHTGLIAEANKIVFGDERDALRYPGVASAGAAYNIDGPLKRRIRVALSLRTSTGAPSQAIRNAVQSAVAAAINRSPHGQPIAISALTTAAQAVNGVTSVAVASPSYYVGADRIVLQSNEKALVFDMNDITVSFVGE